MKRPARARFIAAELGRVWPPGLLLDPSRATRRNMNMTANAVAADQRADHRDFTELPASQDRPAPVAVCAATSRTWSADNSTPPKIQRLWAQVAFIGPR